MLCQHESGGDDGLILRRGGFSEKRKEIETFADEYFHDIYGTRTVREASGAYFSAGRRVEKRCGRHVGQNSLRDGAKG